MLALRVVAWPVLFVVLPFIEYADTPWLGITKPRNPRHLGTIEGGRNGVSGGRTTKNTQSL